MSKQLRRHCALRATLLFASFHIVKIILRLLLYLCLTSWAAAEIFAWKVPLSNLAPEGVDMPGVFRLEAAPEKSPFFSEGDKLWDIRSAMPDAIAKAGVSPEWAVWNATSGRIVTKGPLSTIYSLHHHLDTEHLPTNCRVGLDFFKVPAGGAPPDFAAKPNASLALAIRSGHKSSTSILEEGGAIKLECEPIISYDNTDIDLWILVSATFSDSPKLEINTSTTLRDQTGVWIARDYDGKTGMDIRLTAVVELLDGTPYSEVTLRQDKGLAVPFRVDRSFLKPVAIGDGWLCSYWIGDANFRRSFFGQVIDEDPFAATPKESAPVPEGIAEVQAPEKFAPYFAGLVFDLTDEIKKQGIIIKEGDFAGYDSLNQRIFMYSSDTAELDKFEQLFGLRCFHSPSDLAITIRGSSEMMLIARSGQKASLKSTRPELKLTRELELEPTIGENEDIVDLRLVYEEKSGETSAKSLNSASTLTVGKFAKILESALPDGTENNMEIKAERAGGH